jgi:Tfp pilus assembly protein PilN
MTATLMPPGAAASSENALRMLPIAANLLPLEIVESRRGRKVRRGVFAALTALTVMLAAWYGLTDYGTSSARNDLNGIEDAATAVQRQQHDFTEVVNTQSQSRAIAAQLGVLFADDLQWSALFSATLRAAPAGIAVTSVSGSLAEKDATGGAGNGVELPNPSGEKVVGTLTISGVASGKPAVSAYMDNLSTVAGLGNPLLAGLNAKDGALEFTVRVDLTTSALGGRYTASTDGSGER